MAATSVRSDSATRWAATDAKAGHYLSISPRLKQKVHKLRIVWENDTPKNALIQLDFGNKTDKKELNNRYTTYSLFINGDEAGMFHQVGDCCSRQYYFEALNKRCKYEVTEIMHAAAKEIRKQNKESAKKVTGTLSSSNEYSYFK